MCNWLRGSTFPLLSVWCCSARGLVRIPYSHGNGWIPCLPLAAWEVSQRGVSGCLTSQQLGCLAKISSTLLELDEQTELLVTKLPLLACPGAPCSVRGKRVPLSSSLAWHLRKELSPVSSKERVSSGESGNLSDSHNVLITLKKKTQTLKEINESSRDHI